MRSDKRLGVLWWLPFGRVPEVPAGELQRCLAGDYPPQILDVRTRVEWRRGHIVGAINLPINELRRGLPGLGLATNRPVVAICLSAHRSIPAVRLLRARGFEDAAQLQGGMLAWWRQDLPAVAEDGE
jgi:rhodanese-related sulfurtransferase